MTATTISPNMNLPVPDVGTEPGPDWANDLNACMAAIDSHDHGTGQGVPVTPDGINITSDLPMNGNDLTTARSVRFAAQSAPISAGTDLGCLYEAGVDLYYNDGAGNQVRITQSGSVTGATGTITGLPSGTASASFAGGTFSWRSATNTPATMSTGPLVIGAQIASPHTVTVGASAVLAANYSMTLPLALPTAATASVLAVDSTGAMSAPFATRTFTGSITAGAGNSVTLMASGSYNTLLGMIGMGNISGSTNYNPIGSSVGGTTETSCYFTQNSSPNGTIRVVNNDASAAAYTVTVFYT
jgi:hypothetical protein